MYSGRGLSLQSLLHKSTVYQSQIQKVYQDADGEPSLYVPGVGPEPKTSQMVLVHLDYMLRHTALGHLLPYSQCDFNTARTAKQSLSKKIDFNIS